MSPMPNTTESDTALRDRARALESAAARARTDLDAAKQAAERLTGDGLRELTWITDRLGTITDAEAAPGTELSEREADVIRLIALGYSNKEIAAQLKVSSKTIETYKSRSLEKLGLQSRVDIVRYAIRRGWFGKAG